MESFIGDAEEVVDKAKNAYAVYSKTENKYIVTSEDGTTKGMCITIDGLYENGFYSQEHDWDGYVVIEEKNNSLFYTLWFTNKKYVIDGYESSMIKDLSIKEGTITKYNDDSFQSRVRTSFTGTSAKKGGTGGEETINNKRYEAVCINEKVE